MATPDKTGRIHGSGWERSLIHKNDSCTAKTIASGKAITYGTTDSPIKVKGTVRGEALTADNFATFLVGDGGITAGGEIDTANVLFGE